MSGNRRTGGFRLGHTGDQGRVSLEFAIHLQFGRACFYRTRGFDDFINQLMPRAAFG